MQLLEKTDDAVAEETLGDGHRLRYFGAAAHGAGGDRSSRRCMRGSREEEGKQYKSAKFAAVLEEHEVEPNSMT